MSKSLVIQCSLVLLSLMSISSLLSESFSIKPISKCFGSFKNELDSCSSHHDRELSLNGLRKAYKDINTYLMSSVLSSDFEANIEKANQLLDKEVYYKKKGSSDRKSLAAKRSASANRDVEVLISALVQLTDLDKVNQPCQCTMRTTRVLIDNDRAADGAIERKLVALNGSESRASKEAQANVVRIDELIFEAALRRAQVCYPAIYEQKWLKLSQTLENESSLLGAFFDQVFANRLNGEGIKSIDSALGQSVLELLDWLDKSASTVLQAENLRLVLEFIKKTHPTKANSPERLSNSFMGDQSKTKADKWLAMFLRYLMKPCERLVSVLGPIFESVHFDSQLRDHLGLHEPSENQLDLAVDFYRDLAKYKMCNKLEAEKKHFADILSRAEQENMIEEPLT